MSLLFIHARILTMEQGTEILENAMLAVEGDRIVYVGPEDATWMNKKWDRVLDMGGKLIMPGLINTHTHLSMAVLRGCGSDLPLMTWLDEAIYPREDRFTDEDYTAGAMAAAAEMIRSGTTCCLDMYMGQDKVAKVMNDVGMRAVLMRSLAADDMETLRWKLQENIDLYDAWNGAGNGRIRVWFSAHAVYTVNPETAACVARAAWDRHTGVSVHLSESRSEVEGCMARYGITPAAFMEKSGIFDGLCVAAHCVHLTEADEDILLRRHVAVSHNPCSNMKLASGCAPVDRYLKRGLTVALGTDSVSSNNRLDMFREMYTAGIIHKGFSDDPTAVNAEQVLHMATVDGARALGMEKEIGSLKVGKKADLIALNLEEPAYHPLAHLASHLVYSANSADVALTMVDGKILMENRQMKTLDMAETMRRLELCAQRIR